ncbi:MAG: aspartate--tRNA ligase [Deltaproteobacteria bacterium]|nr:aspartate--tRNA ligase [Deltaproteobacteria bacterium]
MNWKQRTYCGDLTADHSGRDILLMGWVDAIRDHGRLIFIHLRDVRGIIQVVFSPETNMDIYEMAASLKEEYVIEVRGKVAMRAKGTANPNLTTGDIEVLAYELTIFSRSKPMPFHVSEKAMVFGEEIKDSPEHVDEDLRLKYRYLDLRRPSMQEILIKRYRILSTVRDCLSQLHFTEVETPFLTRSTPEGARDYLVPSRIHHGKFYALPQSPQLFKQLLMISGMDRYFQIARCFRDEDLRPNRQPEFTQVDMEASFVDEEFIYEVIEELTVRMFSHGNIKLERPFPRMTYREAMEQYGSDRPDLRFGMAFEDITEILKDTGYSVFKEIIKKGGVIKGFCVKGESERLSKNILQNEYSMKIAPSLGAKGMTWMKVLDGKLQSNIVQFFTPDEQSGIMEGFKAHDGDVLIMIADRSRDLVNRVLCGLRLHLAERLGLIPDNVFRPLWVTEFPLFERKEDGLGSQHHPFTMPDRTDFDPDNIDELLTLNSRAYDLVMNGEELGGGSIRIHDMEVQQKIFKALGMGQEEIQAKFGFFLTALEYGTPPHAGLALGMDRVIAMILKRSSIRDVIAFPKNRKAFCPLSQAPADVDKKQLDELDIERVSKSHPHPQKSHVASGESLIKISADRISEQEVLHVAKLARLTLSAPEIKEYRKDLNSILNYVGSLEEIDTRDVEPMSHVIGAMNIWREDEPNDTGKPEALSTNAPMMENGCFRVPRILENK